MTRTETVTHVLSELKARCQALQSEIQHLTENAELLLMDSPFDVMVNLYARAREQAHREAAKLKAPSLIRTLTQKYYVRLHLEYKNMMAQAGRPPATGAVHRGSTIVKLGGPSC